MPAQLSIAATAVLLCVPAVCAAAKWSDTALSWRIGNRFREPFNPLDIRKNIFALTHAGGYKYPRHRQAARRRPVRRLRLEFWNDKFGNTAATTGKRGQRASTQMVRADVISETNWPREIHPHGLLANVNRTLPETPRCIPCINLPYCQVVIIAISI